jgi:hypothetical protein
MAIGALHDLWYCHSRFEKSENSGKQGMEQLPTEPSGKREITWTSLDALIFT